MLFRSGYAFASWAKGYGDFRPIPDFDTLRLASWLPRTALVLCDVYRDDQHELVPLAPRSILRRQLARAAERGFGVMAASELELYVFKDSYEQVAEKNFINPTPIGRIIEDYHILQGTKEEHVIGAIRTHLERSGIPVESSKGEWGPGQQEIGLRCASALEMADRHTIYKHAAKEIAWKKGHAITFMAKWDQQHAGSSCHIHFSLWKDGKNVFKKDGDHFRWFLGGWMKHVPELMPFYAPTINSYKRFVDASWAPTRLAWSYDNRTAGFRVIGEGSGMRIECRIAGADANPYLALAASLASGLDGIRNKIEPPKAFVGDVYGARNLQRVPYTLAQAVEAFDRSKFAQQAFGAEVHEHYNHFFRSEVAAFDKAVTDWERKRYFERI